MKCFSIRRQKFVKTERNSNFSKYIRFSKTLSFENILFLAYSNAAFQQGLESLNQASFVGLMLPLHPIPQLSNSKKMSSPLYCVAFLSLHMHFGSFQRPRYSILYCSQVGRLQTRSGLNHKMILNSSAKSIDLVKEVTYLICLHIVYILQLFQTKMLGSGEPLIWAVHGEQLRMSKGEKLPN